MDRKKSMDRVHRVVIKVGTSTMTHAGGRINLTRMDRLCRVIAQLTGEGKEVALVTSGAIGVGQDRLHLAERPQRIETKQVTAAVGQCILMNMYSRFFMDYGYAVGQILLTRDILDHESGRVHCVNTLNEMFAMGVIPIVNENDTIAIDEIGKGEFTFGENDTLSAVVATLIGADLIIILSDIDGLYDKNPAQHPDAQLIPTVDRITDQLLQAAGGAGTQRGTGGMITKLKAARFAGDRGIDLIIAQGRDPMIVARLFEGEALGTYFPAPGR